MSPDTQSPPAPHLRATLLLSCLAQFMVILDVSVVNVALPSIRHGLGFTEADLQWVVNAYTVTFAGFLLLGGRAADLLGRRRVFVAGLTLFALASLAGGVADSQGVLIAARAVQGLGGAVIAPASLSILTTTFAEGAARNRAVGIWGAMGGAGGAAGVLLGGILTDLLSWRWILFINVPIGLIAAVAAQRLLLESRNTGRAREFDLRGALAATVGLSLLVLGIVRTDQTGWGDTSTLLLIGGRHRAAGRVRAHRGPLRPLAADAAADLPLADAQRGQRHRAARRRGLVRDVVLRVAVPAAGARLLPHPRRAGLPADDAVHRRRVHRRLAAGRARGRQADPHRRDDLADRRAVLVHRHLGERHLRRVDAVPVAADRARASGWPSCRPPSAPSPAWRPRRPAWPRGWSTPRGCSAGALGLAILAAIATARTTSELHHAGTTAHAALVSGFQLAFLVAAGFALVGAAGGGVRAAARCPRGHRRRPRQMAAVESA